MDSTALSDPRALSNNDDGGGGGVCWFDGGGGGGGEAPWGDWSGVFVPGDRSVVPLKVIRKLRR